MPEAGSGSTVRRVVAGLATAAALAVPTAAAGIPGGLAWYAIAPRALVVVTGRGAADVVHPETAAFIAADGWFCAIGLAGGILCGLAAYFTAVRRHGAWAAAGVIAGGLGASLIAWQLGHGIGHGAFHSHLMASHAGAVLHAPLTLRARSALVSWPAGAALTVVAAELLAGRKERRLQPAGALDGPRAGAGTRRQA